MQSLNNGSNIYIYIYIYKCIKHLLTFIQIDEIQNMKTGINMFSETKNNDPKTFDNILRLVNPAKLVACYQSIDKNINDVFQIHYSKLVGRGFSISKYKLV